ncbi:MAG: SH3 domain-containing protein [Clostridia bacterium]|jgi:uncharacterized protein YgiM (DUF1202 family)|nr:SH3 domain-containing protein [Clostridia bacterium]
MPDITLKDLESVTGGVGVRKGYVLIINCQHACNVRAEPNAESEKIGYAYANEKLPYYGKTGNWYRVKINNSKFGYVYKDFIAVID